MTAKTLPRDLLVNLVGKENVDLATLLQARVRETPSATFLWTPSRSWTYRSAEREVAAFSGYLVQRRVVGPEHRVVSFLNNRPEALWAWLGTVWSGATYVPIHRQQRGGLLADQIRRAGPSLIVTDRDGLAVLADAGLADFEFLLVDHPDEQPRPTRATIARWEDVESAEGLEHPEPSGELASVLFTSGTTGRSKAVRLTHRQCVRGGATVAWSTELRPNDVFHCWWPLYHVAAMVDTVIPVLVAGATVALFERFSLSRFWDEIEASRATVFGGMTHMLELLWDQPRQATDPETPLRAGVIGYVPPDLGSRFEQRFEVRLFDTYGMTEIEPIALPHPGVAVPKGACGRANPDLEIAVVDTNGYRVRVNEPGEIVVRPRHPGVLFDGYEGDAEATVKAWQDLWFHTGDLGCLDEDGNLTFIDRLKDVIRRRGENISPWELERAVSEHPDVAECAAVGVPSPRGEDDVMLIVVPHKGAQIEPSELHEWCKARLARFMLPRFIEVRPELPRNATGKVLRSALGGSTTGAWDAEADNDRLAHTKDALTTATRET